MVFADDGRGVSGSLGTVFNSGYTTGELAMAREQNRMFHRGLVLALDSLSADVFVFSRSANAPGGTATVHVSRYGPALNAVVRRRSSNVNLPQQTINAQLTDGQLLKGGVPLNGDAIDTLLEASVFADVAALHAFVDARFAARPAGRDAPGFIGALVLKPRLGITATADGDIMQGDASLRTSLCKRYVPSGVGLSGVATPACEVTLQHVALLLPQWNPAHTSPVYSCVVRFPTGASSGPATVRFHEYSIELQLALTTAVSSDNTDWTPPRVTAVLDGSCIAVDVPLNALVNKYIDKAQEAAWSRRANGKLYGHERNGCAQLMQLCGHVNNAKNIVVNPSEFHEGPAMATTPLVNTPGVQLLSSEQFVHFNKKARALLVGCGTTAIASIKLLEGPGFDASNLLSADKDELRNEQLAKQVRLLHARALVHWRRNLFALRHGAAAKECFESFLAEEQAARDVAAAAASEAAAERQRKEVADAAAAAQKAGYERAQELEVAARRERAQAALKGQEAEQLVREGRRAQAAEEARRKAEHEAQAAAHARHNAAAVAKRNAAAADAEQFESEDRSTPRGRRAVSGRRHVEAPAGAADGADQGNDDGAGGVSPQAPASKRTRRGDGSAAPALPTHCDICRQPMERRIAAAAQQRRDAQLTADQHMLRDKDQEIEALKLRLNRALGRE
jgi:hypothetical protein